MSGVDDWQLVARAQAGDMTAFTELVHRYEAPVMQFCLRMVGSMQDAEDLAQEAFVRVHRHLHRLEPRARFITVLFGIARNLALNALRDSGRRGRGRTSSLDVGPPVGDESHRPDRAARLSEIESVILKALEAVSPEHREVLILREMNGLDYDAIAEVIGCRKGTVKSRLARAREQLRLQVIALGGEEL